MLSPNYLDHVADDIVELYANLDQTIIKDIVRRLAKTGKITDTASWQIEMVQQSGLTYDTVISETAKMSSKSEDEIKKLFESSGVKSLDYDIKIYEAAGLSPTPLTLSPSAMQILIANITKTNSYLKNLTMTTANQAQQLYIQAATLAEMQIESGAFDYNTAIRNAIKNAAKEGAWIQYPPGHRDRLDVAIRRAVLTGVGQTAAQISIAYADDMGCDLVETTAHMGARPSHTTWQGRIFSRSGRHSKYPDFVVNTGYGSGDGLCGWNCRHSFFPFFEGLSKSAYPRDLINSFETKKVKYNGKTITYYDATQEQRKIERSIRAAKRELAAYDEAIKQGIDMQNDFNYISQLLKEREAKLIDLLNQTGLIKDTARQQVAGFGKSQAMKPFWANKKTGI